MLAHARQARRHCRRFVCACLHRRRLRRRPDCSPIRAMRALHEVHRCARTIAAAAAEPERSSKRRRSRDMDALAAAARLRAGAGDAAQRARPASGPGRQTRRRRIRLHQGARAGRRRKIPTPRRIRSISTSAGEYRRAARPVRRAKKRSLTVLEKLLLDRKCRQRAGAERLSGQRTATSVRASATRTDPINGSIEHHLGLDFDAGRAAISRPSPAASWSGTANAPATATSSKSITATAT